MEETRSAIQLLFLAGYETQFEFPPDEYKLRAVPGDGESFGRVDSLLSIEPL